MGTIKFVFFHLITCFAILANTQVVPQTFVSMWRNTFGSSSPPGAMYDPILAARTGRAGASQQASQFPRILPRNRQILGITRGASMREVDELSNLNSVCSVPSLSPCVPIAGCTAATAVADKALCICPAGYSGDGRKPELGGEGCVNIDECALNLHECDLPMQECIDFQGYYECKCKSGYELLPNGKICVDIDECDSPSLNNCDDDVSLCHNLEGSYRCDCKDATMIMDYTTGKCRDLNECVDFNGIMNPCEQVCINQDKGVSCGCIAGFKLRADGKSCEDVDECLNDSLHKCDPQGVISKCVNSVGGYSCQCNNDLGYITSKDGISCKNLDECLTFPYICGGDLSCCQDLAPPERFACSMPIEEKGIVNSTIFNNAVGAVSSPLREAYNMPFAAVSMAPVAFANFTNTLSKVTTNLVTMPITGLLSGFGDKSNLFQDSYVGGEVGKYRRLSSEKMSSNLNSNPYEDWQNVDDNKNVLKVVANNQTFYEIQDKLIELYYMQDKSSQNLSIVGNGLLRSPLVGKEKALFDVTAIVGSQVRAGGIASDILPAGRQYTCPFGFDLGSDLYRAKVRENTKYPPNGVSKFRISTSGEELRGIQPRYVPLGGIENSKATFNEVGHWYAGLKKVPFEVVSTALG